MVQTHEAQADSYDHWVRLCGQRKSQSLWHQVHSGWGRFVWGGEGSKLVRDDFQSKWKANDANKHECIDDFLCAHGGTRIDVPPDQCEYAFKHARDIRKQIQLGWA